MNKDIDRKHKRNYIRSNKSEFNKNQDRNLFWLRTKSKTLFGKNYINNNLVL